MDSTKKNISYNMLYQVVVLIIPLITAPYLSRVLGKEGIGIYTYTHALSNYFVLFSMLGLANYGNRAIAQSRDNKKEMSNVFSEIYTMQIIISLCACVVYALMLFIISEYRNIFLLQYLFVISAMFDVSWFYYGIEQFKKILTRNMVLRLVMLAGIFLFVKNPSDLWKYTLIMASGTFLSQIYLWLDLKKQVKFNFPAINRVTRHFKANIVLFVPVIAVSLYHTMDKVMLGTLSTMDETGIYENADKLVTIPLTLITAVGTVMMPKMSNLFARKEEQRIKLYLRDSMQLISAMAFAMAFGMASIAEKFAPLYFGSEFYGCAKIIIYLSPIMVFASVASVIRMQYLIPKGKDISYLISVIAGAVVNLIINSLLIPRYGAIGAATGTVGAEFIVMFIQFFSVRDKLPISRYLRDMIPFIISGTIMFIILFKVREFTKFTLIGVCADVIVGGVVYVVISLIVMSIIDLHRMKHIMSLVKGR